MKFILSLLLFMHILTSCKQAGEAKPAETFDSSLQKTLPNVAYGKDSLQVMDIYLPKGRSAATTQSLILLHGGGWTSGSKEEFTSHIDSFQARLPDYAIFNINYRLAGGGNLFPSQENDARAAIDFIVESSQKYQVNKDGFVLLGVSAGAHLALLQAYKNASPRISAVIDYFGPADLLTMYAKPWHPLVPLALQMVTGTTPQADPALYSASSPIEFVTAQSPPTLILHGGRDEVVNVSQSKALAQKLELAGVKHQLKIFPNERHGRWYGKSLIESFDLIEKFLQDHAR